MNQIFHKLVSTHTISQEWVQLSAIRPIRIQNLKVPRGIEPHDHDYYEICMVRNGSAIHQTESSETELVAGSVLIMPPGKVHAFQKPRDFEVTNIYYLAEWLLPDLKHFWEHEGLVPMFLAANLFRRDLQPQIPEFQLQGDRWENLLRELEDLSSELEITQPSLIYLKSSFLKILILLARAYGASQTRPTGFQFRREIWMALEKVETCISNSEPFNVFQVSKTIGISVDYFSRLFRDATGLAPMDYFQQQRIHRACALLLNPQYSITEISYSLGFSDAAHFCRTLTRHRGISPSAYRKIYLSKT